MIATGSAIASGRWGAQLTSTVLFLLMCVSCGTGPEKTDIYTQSAEGYEILADGELASKWQSFDEFDVWSGLDIGYDTTSHVNWLGVYWRAFD